jgi:hypothetical protein
MPADTQERTDAQDFDPGADDEQHGTLKDKEPSKAMERARIGSPAWAEFDDRQVALVRSLMPKDATAGDTYVLLELAARYQLDPFAKEIWAAPMGTGGKVAILIGRDGLLKVASRDPGYIGMTARAVHENDEFELLDEPVPRKVEAGAEGLSNVWSYVSHKAGKPSERGELVGAFCEVYKRGEPATFFYAALDEYMPQSETKLQYSPWKQQKTAMIVKCAISNALRLAVRISGVYVEEEMSNVLDRGDVSNQPAPADFGDDEQLAQWLGDLFAAAEATRPGSFGPGLQRAKLADAARADDPEAAREALAYEVAEFIEKYGGTVPAKPEALEGEVIDTDETAADARTKEQRKADDAARAERLRNAGVDVPAGESEGEPPTHIEGQESLIGE